jgi:hypothetical protein
MYLEFGIKQLKWLPVCNEKADILRIIKLLGKQIIKVEKYVK